MLRGPNEKRNVLSLKLWEEIDTKQYLNSNEHTKSGDYV